MPRRRSDALPRLSVLLAMAVTAACTTGSQPSGSAAREGRQCFRASEVNGFTAVDDRTVDVHTGVNEVYRLELFGYCPDVDWTQAIAIRSRGSSWICQGFDAELFVPSTIGTQRCPVKAVRKLTDDEIKAGKAPAKESR